MSEDLTAVVDRAARAYAAAVGEDFDHLNPMQQSILREMVTPIVRAAMAAMEAMTPKPAIDDRLVIARIIVTRYFGGDDHAERLFSVTCDPRDLPLSDRLGLLEYAKFHAAVPGFGGR